MAKKRRARSKSPCPQGLIDHLVKKHIQFECTTGRGKPNVSIKVSLAGQGESPCPYCTIQMVSSCSQWPC
jgi:hypothetical protein